MRLKPSNEVFLLVIHTSLRVHMCQDILAIYIFEQITDPFPLSAEMLR